MSAPAPDGPVDLKKVYAVINPSYDRMNRVMSLGMDLRWRREAALLAASEAPPGPVLDLCGGTGDMTLACAAAGLASVVSCDFSGAMLARAADKCRRAGIEFRPALGDAAALPFADHSFAAVVTAFGIRNLTFDNPRRDRHLAEIFRVLAPGGLFLALETAKPAGRPLGLAVRAYVKTATVLAGLLSGARREYAYLERSTRGFFTDEEFAALLLEGGFVDTRHRALLAGAAAIHWARKPA